MKYPTGTDKSSRYESGVQTNFGPKIRLVLSVGLSDVVVDESSEVEFVAKICLNTGFIPRRFYNINSASTSRKASAAKIGFYVYSIPHHSRRWRMSTSPSCLLFTKSKMGVEKKQILSYQPHTPPSPIRQTKELKLTLTYNRFLSDQRST